MKRILNSKGLSYVEACAWVLVLCMLLSIVISYASMMILIQTANNNTERVMESYLTQNSKSIYDNLKNGHDTTTTLNQNTFLATLKEELALVQVGSELHYKTPDGHILYRTTNPRVSFNVLGRAKLKATYNIIIPVEFAGKVITNLHIPQRVIVYYNLK